MKAILIPLKDPARAKTRLAEVLSPDERGKLTWAMFEDVSRAVALAMQPDRVILVSSFGPAIDRAREMGWEVMVEQAQHSESASVDWASQALEERGFQTVMRLPADIPLVRAEDIDQLLAIEPNRSASVLVPSRDGTGTNAIVRTPPTLFPSRFGSNSLALHRSEAARVRGACAVVENARIALDIDEPVDLELLLEVGGGTEAHRVLGTIELVKKTSR